MGFNRIQSVTGNPVEVECAAAGVIRRHAIDGGDARRLLDACGLDSYSEASRLPAVMEAARMACSLAGQLRIKWLRPGQAERSVPGQYVEHDGLLDLVGLVVVAASRAGDAAGFPHVIHSCE